MKNNIIIQDEIVLNLQLFADAFYGAGGVGETNSTGSEGLKGEGKEYYDKVLLESAKSKMVFEQLSEKKRIPEGEGKTINMRRFNNLPPVTKPLAEGVTPAAQALEMETLTATLNQYGAYVRLTDWVQKTSVDPVLSVAIKKQGYQAGQTRDRVCKEEVTSTTNIMWVPKRADGTETPITADRDMDNTCLLSVKDIQQAIAKMKNNNIEPREDGCYVAVIHPQAAFDLKQDPRFDDWHKYTDAEALYKGEIGKIDNCRFIETPTAAVSDIDVLEDEDPIDTFGVFNTLIFGDGAFCTSDIDGGIETIIKPLGSGDDPLNQRATAGWKTNMAAKLLNTEAVLNVRSYAPKEYRNEATGGYA